MISHIVVGDITERNNPDDIIIGMNTAMEDVLGIGRPFVQQITATRAIKLGSVISFDFDGKRQLHMLMCHKLGPSGWGRAEQFVRFGMDYLWDRHPKRTFSIVQIGTGRVGLRDGADSASIHTAMAQSFLTATLYILDDKQRVAQEARLRLVPKEAISMWDFEGGETKFRVAA